VPQQFTLAIQRPHEQRLQNFVVGANDELLAILESQQTTFAGYWIFGDLSSGRSHLLRGCCLLAQDQSASTNYIGCVDFSGDAGGLTAALENASKHGQVVAVDDVALIAGHAGHEELLMTIYQRLLQERGRLLVAHSHPAQVLEFVTPDLASRMKSLQHFQIQPLQDADKVELLRRRAQNRGYELSHSVLDYWLVRGPRDLGALLSDLDLLDQASLARKQQVTIPLLKQVLGY